MKTSHLLARGTLAVLFATASVAVLAQGRPGAGPGGGQGVGPGYGAGYQARQAASAPGAGAGPMRGPGAGPMGPRMGRFGAEYTPGWTLMSAQERNEHRERITAAKTYEECVSLMSQHREQMAERAKTQGRTLGTPRRDACEPLKP